MLFPSPSTWKMVKYAPNKIPDNMIGYDQNPRKIHKDGYIPILLAVLITPTKYCLTLLEPGFTNEQS